MVGALRGSVVIDIGTRRSGPSQLIPSVRPTMARNHPTDASPAQPGRLQVTRSSLSAFILASLRCCGTAPADPASSPSRRRAALPGAHGSSSTARGEGARLAWLGNASFVNDGVARRPDDALLKHGLFVHTSASWLGYGRPAWSGRRSRGAVARMRLTVRTLGHGRANKGMKQTKPAQAMGLRSLSPVLGGRSQSVG
jgi:hypothetical protein